MIGQSPVRPPAYLIWRVPKPTMLLPHIRGSALVAFCIRSAVVEQSSRTCLSGIFWMNLSTLSLVALVLGSAIPVLSRKHRQYQLREQRWDHVAPFA